MADQRPQNPRQVTLLEYLLGRGRGAPGQTGANRVDSQADSVRHFRNNALPAVIGQPGFPAPTDPFAPGDGAMPPGPEAQPRTVTVNPQPRYGMPEALMASAFPGSNAPGPVSTGGPASGPAVRAPVPQSEEQIMAALAAMDPSFNTDQTPMLSAFEDTPPIGDVLTIEAPPLPGRQPGPASAPQGQPPVGDILTIPAPGRGVYRPSADQQAVLQTPVPAPAQAFQQPPVEIGGPPAAGPRPFAQAPQPADVSFADRGGAPSSAVPTAGLLRRPIPTPTLNNAAAAPIQAPDLTALRNAEQFLGTTPTPLSPMPKPPAAAVKPGAPPVPPAAGGAQTPAPAPEIGAQLPQHLKEQLLAEAQRLTAKRAAAAPMKGV